MKTVANYSKLLVRSNIVLYIIMVALFATNHATFGILLLVANVLFSFKLALNNADCRDHLTESERRKERDFVHNNK
ncbi:hypothetical protein IV38_GL001217 [Lactobacillus selangorensis]|uniref:Uncharacterized protein n=1 Tax=Lactobacillus selangorensis TaxID=81857 RepID=A0A0R2FYA9_9LACO|nr:hypothetical protein [Lactobacillus selangorensis]KRN29003.1 hypothetical protein IV38_GL001217 [Lactobacillus selangorensis]KRN32587.1 hypothetical protein IV40_GL000636 [Lactobacillus selangorensis]